MRGSVPSPWGEGEGEGALSLRRYRAPSPQPLPGEGAVGDTITLQGVSALKCRNIKKAA